MRNLTNIPIRKDFLDLAESIEAVSGFEISFLLEGNGGGHLKDAPAVYRICEDERTAAVSFVPGCYTDDGCIHELLHLRRSLSECVPSLEADGGNLPSGPSHLSKRAGALDNDLEHLTIVLEQRDWVGRTDDHLERLLLRAANSFDYAKSPNFVLPWHHTQARILYPGSDAESALTNLLKQFERTEQAEDFYTFASTTKDKRALARGMVRRFNWSAANHFLVWYDLKTQKFEEGPLFH